MWDAAVYDWLSAHARKMCVRCILASWLFGPSCRGVAHPNRTFLHCVNRSHCSYKANFRNMQLIEDHLKQPAKAKRADTCFLFGIFFLVRGSLYRHR